MSFLLNLFRSKNREVDVTICGLDNAGKTTIVKYLETGEFVETQPTMGINRGESIHSGKIEINVFDLGGQEDFRQLWSEVNEKSDGIVYVVDKTDVMRFEESYNVFHNVLKSQLHKDIKILVLLHKSDEPEGLERNRFIKEFGLLEMPFQWACYETSAKTGENIYEAFKWFVESLKEVS